MRTLEQHLTQYAAYHRDRRNLLTHIVGIPVIVFSVVVLMSCPVLLLGALSVTPALFAALCAGVFYLKLDARFGTAMCVFLALCLWLASPIAAQGTLIWRATSIGLFLVGWLVQFVGHYFEGRKPAFLDDVAGLIIGPLFVVAELAFMLGLRPALNREIDGVVGPLH